MARLENGWVRLHSEICDEILGSCGPIGMWLWAKILCFAETETTDRWVNSIKVTVRPGQLLVDLNRFARGFTAADAAKLVDALRVLQASDLIDFQQTGTFLFVKVIEPHNYIPEIPSDLGDQEFQRIVKSKTQKPREFSPFFRSREWRELRFRVLRDRGAKCCLCNATRNDGVAIHVDHIKPRSKFPELALDYDNMQVLCEACNLGKGNWDFSDFRKSEDA